MENEDRDPNISLTKSDLPDMVSGRYKILLHKHRADKSNIFAKAYEVEDTKLDPEKKYALCFDPQMPIRLEAINHQKKHLFPNLIAPIDVQIVKLSSNNKHHVVTILPLVENLESLTNYIKINGPLEEDVLIRQILNPLHNTLKKLEDIGVTHGRFNLDNIFIDSKNRLILGECISEPCGYSQHHLYEPINRMDLTPIGKGEGDSSADYFAFGIISLFCQLGRLPVSEKEIESLITKRLERGSIEVLIGQFKFSPAFKNLYRGIFSDKKFDRWRGKAVNDWLRGSKYSVIPSGDANEASRHLIFNDNYYSNRRAVVHALSEEWDMAKKFLKEDKLVKWVERNLEDGAIASMLENLRDLRISGKGLVVMDDDEFVARSLFLIDPDKILRMRDLKISGDALGTVIAFCFSRNQLDHLKYLAKIIAGNFFTMWLDNNKHITQIGSKSVTKIASDLIEYVKKSQLGFGIERCMYEIDPTISCQSPILGGDYVTHVSGLLLSMEHSNLETQKKLVDRHIAAYIAAKLDVASEFTLNSLSGFPQFANNEILLTLAILSSAQRYAKVKNLSKLCYNYANRLYSVLDNINNIDLKKEVASKLSNASESGDLFELYKIMVDKNMIKFDKKGFEKALVQYKILNREIHNCTNRKRTEQIGYNIGLRICVVISYLICSIIIIVTMSRAL